MTINQNRPLCALADLHAGSLPVLDGRLPVDLGLKHFHDLAAALKLLGVPLFHPPRRKISPAVWHPGVVLRFSNHGVEDFWPSGQQAYLQQCRKNMFVYDTG